MEPGALPEIEGTARYRSELSIEEPNWGPGRVELAYQWLRDGKTIKNATETSYRLAAGDIGHKVSVRITGTKEGFTQAVQKTAAIGPVEPGKLRAFTPDVTGTARVGRTLTGSVDEWGPGEVRLAWQWYRDDAKIEDANGKTYQLTASDLGHRIKLRIRGYAENFTTKSMYSETSGKVTVGVLDPTPVPLYSGNAQVGHTLTALPREWGPGEVKLAYQWYRGKTKIAKATKVEYKLTPADAGQQLRVRVRGTKTGYETVYKYSGYTAAVSLGDLEPVLPTIEGQTVVGQTLTAHPGVWGPGEVALSVRWYANGVLLTRATGETYTLSGAEAGQVIVVRVIGRKDGYAERIVDSAPTSPVVSRERR